jgi:putative spermidine/putrescine transport system substrate-binding protein
MVERDVLQSGSSLSRRQLLQRGTQGAMGIGALGGMSALLAACGSGSSGGSGGKLPVSLDDAGGMDALVKAAQKDGHLNVLAVPPDWANYGEQIKTFTANFNVPISSLSPDFSSAEEIQAIKRLKGQKRAPDTFDISPTFALQGTTAGLFSTYKPSTWDTIPDNMKDADGHWVGPYWGAISFGTNVDVAKEAPKTWEDLLNPRYKGMVALDGDPRTAGDAFGAVMAASIANGGSLDDIEPGIEFFAKLKKAGNYIPASIEPATIANGSTPIAVQWDYLNLANKKKYNGHPNFEVTIPEVGVLGNYYCDGCSVNAPNPHAVRLWIEYLMSDEGQLTYIGGYAHPARYDDLVKRNKVPQEVADTLPPPDAYKDVSFPSVKQTEDATKVLTEQWGPKVAGS